MSDATFWVDKDSKELVLKDDKGESRFYIESDFVIDGVKYLIVIESDADENTEALPIKIVNENGKEYIEPVTDEDEFAKVRKKFEEEND
ncbi:MULTISPECIES: DUF1292 domain-containing protein [unclassified Halanaerobium]|uniref:DUF1292 domain-containing protein n=1 Tax=unclassified Halanaerobium TaxID=2641197 RepID=UPI000DF38EDA|nr:MULTISPECIES: DUF1292 domain-containing protein [unclassified Halanaerobium]RCW50498.1 uncharacterized protein DUF1292 [Halanaerobium sp. MA284_MarDTE_T2]RCW85985.1 uncharacterized protein DUF1292 [Halanaerobium sp. DL-01]